MRDTSISNDIIRYAVYSADRGFITFGSYGAYSYTVQLDPRSVYTRESDARRRINGNGARKTKDPNAKVIKVKITWEIVE